MSKSKKTTKASAQKGLTLGRRNTTPNVNPLDQVEYTKRRSVITNPDGSIVFEMNDVEVPTSWSQLATDIIVSKYFRKRGVPKTKHEVSARQVVHRLAHTLRTAGEKLGGYFATPEDANAFEAELAHYLIHQKGAFNSPVWFNVGLFHEYGIEGSGGNWYWNPDTDKIEKTNGAYEHPQGSACFIQSVDDDLMSIFELAKNEARLFKYGSGTGTNFSKLRGIQERLSGGGTSSGLMSFLEVLDRGAGATKSGGTTRRAAKMVSLDMDHPEIENFVKWKAREEKKVRALIDAGYPADFNGEAYRTVSGQNSNNSVRIPDEFMKSYLEDGSWNTYMRTTGEVCDTYRARELMDTIATAAWSCADPGVQFDTTINNWHTCKDTDRIYGSNPCSEYMFLNDSACNLSSINLMKFYDVNTNTFDMEGYRHAIRIFFIAQEILVDFCSYPTQTIAQNSHDYRPLGLGYANLGTLLMVKGVPYDSVEGRAICSALTGVLTGHAYLTSAEMAASKGAFPGFQKNRKSMLDVIKMHRAATKDINKKACPPEMLTAAQEDWDKALAAGEQHGYRNAQATVIAPTGTIGLLMDCDTTGIEPDFALVKFKKLAGGGYFKIINQSVPAALQRLGYTAKQVDEIIKYVKGTSTLKGSPFINRESLLAKGLSEDAIATVEKTLPGVFDLRFAFNTFTVGKDFTSLEDLGFTKTEIDKAGRVICGAMTIEGAPHLKDEHLPIFDCANKCGHDGKRFLQPMAHVTMMAAAQPFISGAISKTINMPAESTVDEIKELYVKSWELGLKACALYRDGSKNAQPLNTKSDDSKKDEADEAKAVAAAGVAAAAVAASAESAGKNSQLKRRRLPKKRGGFTQEARVGGHKIYLRTGEYEDGTLGELFIDTHKEGAAYRSIMNCFAIAVSLGLQHGVPLEEYVDVFTFTRFEPSGPCDHPNIKMATSLVDYIFRALGYEYLGRTDFLQVKPEEVTNKPTAIASIESAKSSTTSSNSETKNGNSVIAEAFAKAANELGGSRAPATNGKKNGNGSHTSSTMSHTTEETEVTTVVVPGVQASGGSDGLQTASTTGAAKVISVAKSAVSSHLSSMMGDAPFCDGCGNVTVRNGSCYRCLNCGNSMGCS